MKNAVANGGDFIARPYERPLAVTFQRIEFPAFALMNAE
jgi:hypothetical protein